MPKTIKYFICLVGFILFLIGCQMGSDLDKVKGKYITNIRGDELITLDGKSYKLPLTDSSHVYYLVRHAEKDTTYPSQDPPLNAKGEKRAEALFDLFRGTKLDDIYSTLYIRTIATVESVSGTKGMQIKPYEAKKLRDLYHTIVDSTDARRVLIVGHSNTTPVFANFLSDTQYYKSSFAEDEYDHLIIVIDNKSKGKELIPVKFKP